MLFWKMLCIFVSFAFPCNYSFRFNSLNNNFVLLLIFSDLLRFRKRKTHIFSFHFLNFSFSFSKNISSEFSASYIFLKLVTASNTGFDGLRSIQLAAPYPIRKIKSNVPKSFIVCKTDMA